MKSKKTIFLGEEIIYIGKEKSNNPQNNQKL